MKPIRDKLLVKLIDKGEQVRDGIVLPDTMAKEQAEECLVLSVGAKVKHIISGNHVLIDRYSQDTVRVTRDGSDYFIVEESNVLAILT